MCARLRRQQQLGNTKAISIFFGKVLAVAELDGPARNKNKKCNSCVNYRTKIIFIFNCVIIVYFYFYFLPNYYSVSTFKTIFKNIEIASLVP